MGIRSLEWGHSTTDAVVTGVERPIDVPRESTRHPMDGRLIDTATISHHLATQRPKPMFLPTTITEMHARGWTELDVILVTGDSYIDSPHIGVAVVARTLEAAGYRVGIIAQPELETPDDIRRLGAPTLFWGVTAGSVDSMVANYTALKKRRRTDDFTPGGLNDRRPDRAAIVYTNLIRRHCRPDVPIVLGGIEASLRRVSHYDFWSNRIRRSILFDAKADILVYGMGEKPVRALAGALQRGEDYRQIRGICYKADQAPADALRLPDHALVAADPEAFAAMFEHFYHNNDPVTGRVLCQRQDTRYLVQNPPPPPHSMDELDAVYALDFTYDQHPYYENQGAVKALETIRFSLATHRGCYGECHFCAITVHQGRTVQWRSQDSLVGEARRLSAHPRFKGILMDVGGPTANMYGFECDRKQRRGACRHQRCLFPNVCKHLPVDHARQLTLLKALRRLPGMRKVFVASGLRCDLVMTDRRSGSAYIDTLAAAHVSGQLKIAPEHTEPEVLKRMGKPGGDLLPFRHRFLQASRAAGKNQYLTYYFIAAHPGTTLEHMKRLKSFCRARLKITPEQVQIFTPTPSTYSTLMYWTDRDPFSRRKIFVEKDATAKQRQKTHLRPLASARTGKKRPPSRRGSARGKTRPSKR